MNFMLTLDIMLSWFQILDSVKEYDTKYNIRSRYGVELDKADIVKSLNKKLNYRPQKSNTSSFGRESFRWLGSKIWELVHDNVKHVSLLLLLEIELKKLNIYKCSCELCKQYIDGAGYIN